MQIYACKVIAFAGAPSSVQPTSHVNIVVVGHCCCCCHTAVVAAVMLLVRRYQVEREIRIHIQLDHPNIIRLFAAFEDEKYVYMVQVRRGERGKATWEGTPTACALRATACA
jgi:serine/threonine protein kinase